MKFNDFVEAVILLWKSENVVIATDKVVFDNIEEITVKADIVLGAYYVHVTKPIMKGKLEFNKKGGYWWLIKSNKRNKL